MVERLVWRLNDFIAQQDWMHNKIVRFLNNMHIVKYNVHVFLPPAERIVEYPFVYWAVGLPPSRILDVGCYSRLPIELASLGFETFGIDLRKHPFSHPNFKFIQGDISQTDFPENFFDIVTAISVIEHIGLDISHGGKTDFAGDIKTMKEINRILKPGGKLILSVPFSKSRRIFSRVERIYDNHSLNLLLEGFRVRIFRLYACKDRAWGPVKIEKIEDGKKYLALITATNIKHQTVVADDGKVS